MIKNVAAMMFCHHQEQFFPVSYVRMAIFHKGREKSPNDFTELPIIRGTVIEMIRKVLDRLQTNVIKERVIKQKNDARSIRFFNYPYQALEEAVVNAFYHRDYQVREPIEITVEPDRISILSFSGPDRSISMKTIKEANVLRSRRYKNRNLGDFLKELDLSEGWATGIPTIQEELKKNGSPRAVIDTDEERTCFLIDIPCHADFITISNDPKNGPKNDPKNDPKITKRRKTIMAIVTENPNISIGSLAERIAVSYQTVKRDMHYLTEKGYIRHIGPKNGGQWEIIIKESL